MYFCLLLGTVIVSTSVGDNCRLPYGKPYISQYFLRGYNLLTGHPLRLGFSFSDPGYGEAIFQDCYNSSRTTPDGRYLVPDGTNITLCKSCSFDFKTSKISGLNSYRKLLGTKVRVNNLTYNWVNASFGASRGFHFVQDQLSSSFLFTHSDATCCAYKIQIDEAKLPFTENFLKEVDFLPEEYNEKAYMDFIHTFGTHYIDQMDVGSLFSVIAMISRGNVYKMLEDGLNISASNSLFVKKWAKVANDMCAELPEVPGFTDRLSDEWGYFQCTVPPADLNAAKWMEQTMDSLTVTPVSMRIKSMAKLFDRDDILEASKAGKIRENIKKAFKSYCDYLQKNKVIGSCSGAKPDPPFPSTFHPPTWSTLAPVNSSRRLLASTIGNLVYLMLLLFL